MLENFNEDKRKNSMTQFSEFHTGWSVKGKNKSHEDTYISCKKARF